MTKHRFQIERNAEGSKLAYLSPVDEDNKTQSGFRIAGPKAWGGSRTLAEIDLSTNDIVRYIKQYAPDVMNELIKTPA